MTILLWAAAGCLYAEFMGYWLHVLMHSERLPALSRAHMIHHLRLYAPDRPQRPSREYALSTYGRANVLGLGLEWLLPIALLLAGAWLLAGALGAGPYARAAFSGAGLGWGALMFWYMHDAMHLQGFWMEDSPLWRDWFLVLRRRHDIHHMDLSPAGRMDKNYGICLFWFDRLFGSFSDRHQRFNRAALAAANARYADVLR